MKYLVKQLFKTTPSGQTLLETLLAMAIIVIGIISLISLLIQLRFTGNAVVQQATATQLGQEAIEGVRVLRDSNWLKQASGDDSTTYATGLRNGPNYNGIYVWDPTSTDPATAMLIKTIPAGSIASPVSQVYQTASGYYVQTIGASTGLTATPYHRWLTLYPICRNTITNIDSWITADGVDCTVFGSDYIEIGIQVVVHVQWTVKGNTYNEYFEEHLYNWRYAQ